MKGIYIISEKFNKWRSHMKKSNGDELYFIYTKKYHVFAPMGRFQLESIYLYFPPSSQYIIYNIYNIYDIYNSWDDGGK